MEHFDRQHFAEYFPQHFYDLRYENRIPDPCNIGLNETPEIENRFRDYKVGIFVLLLSTYFIQVLRRADKVDDH